MSDAGRFRAGEDDLKDRSLSFFAIDCGLGVSSADSVAAWPDLDISQARLLSKVRLA